MLCLSKEFQYYDLKTTAETPRTPNIHRILHVPVAWRWL